jgi:hypothetical protein
MTRKQEFVWDGRGNRGDDARYSILPGRVATDSDLSAVHFRILTHLGRFNHKKGWCRLDQAELGTMFGVRRQAICTAIGQLVENDYIEKRSQAETGESFCLYRMKIDGSEDQGVSGATDTPSKGECPTGVDTRVRRRQTPVSALRTPYSDQSIDHVDKTTEEELPDVKSGTDGGERLPFTPAVLRHVELLGVERAPLIRRYQARTVNRRIKDPSAYLLGMARDEAAKKLGVPAELLKEVASSDRQARVDATIAAVVIQRRPPAKPSRELKALLARDCGK